MNRKKDIFLLGILIVSVFVINYPLLDTSLENFFNEYETVFVERVIDGDTIVTSENEHIRLLGINTPEKGEFLYQEAKEFLEKEILNKTIQLSFGKEKKDRYNRTLAYVILNNKNINLELVREGFANYYFPSGKDFTYRDFKDAWNSCIENEKNLCAPSKEVCSLCILLRELNIKSQEIILFNQCSFSCNLENWEVKDEGRKKFVFLEFELGNEEEISITVEDFDEEYVWTETGDTLFLRDNLGKLVLWESH